MFTSKDLRGKNSLMDRVQRQEDSAYAEKLKLFDSLSSNENNFKNLLHGKKAVEPIANFSEPSRVITHAELGNKRRLLR